MGRSYKSLLSIRSCPSTQNDLQMTATPAHNKLIPTATYKGTTVAVKSFHCEKEFKVRDGQLLELKQVHIDPIFFNSWLATAYICWNVKHYFLIYQITPFMILWKSGESHLRNCENQKCFNEGATVFESHMLNTYRILRLMCQSPYSFETQHSGNGTVAATFPKKKHKNGYMQLLSRTLSFRTGWQPQLSSDTECFQKYREHDLLRNSLWGVQSVIFLKDT